MRERLAPIVKELQAARIASLRATAAGPNDRGVPTPRGVGEWRGRNGRPYWRGCRPNRFLARLIDSNFCVAIRRCRSAVSRRMGLSAESQ
jgi:hypothetical protein